MKDSNEQVQKLKEILKRGNMPTQSITAKNGFVKVIHRDGNACYFTPDLEYNTLWANFITTENGFVKLIYRDKSVIYYTPDLRHHTSWGKYKAIEMENERVKITHRNGMVSYHTPELIKV